MSATLTRSKSSLPNVVVLPADNGASRRGRQIVRAGTTFPVIPRGAGTSLSGTVLAVTGGVMIALTRMNRRFWRSITATAARLVEAGCVNAWVTNAVKVAGLFYAPDPSSQSACTIGGNVATNSGGRTRSNTASPPTMCSVLKWCCRTAKSSGSARGRTAARTLTVMICAARPSAAKGCLASSRACCVQLVRAPQML